MKLNKALLAVAVSGSLALAAGNATASVYAQSSLDIVELQVLIIDDGALSPLTTITGFNFDATNTAFLNGAGGANTASCFGTPLANNCGAGPVLDADVLNAPGSAPIQGENAFTLQGPGADQYSWADSVVLSSQLVNFVPTASRQAAESELQSGSSASANTNIQAITGFDMQFTVGGDDFMVVQFFANPSMRAAISGEVGTIFGAQGNMAVTFLLTKNGSNEFLRWAPNGDTTTGCIVDGGLVCIEVSDAANIGSNSVATTTNNTTDDFMPGIGFYQMIVGGLSDGDWTLSLRAETSTNLFRIPEPGTVLLLGIGLMGLASRARRRA